MSIIMIMKFKCALQPVIRKQKKKKKKNDDIVVVVFCSPIENQLFYNQNSFIDRKQYFAPNKTAMKYLLNNDL